MVVEGVSSSFLNVTSGMPQGSVLGSLLFLLYTNDLPSSVTHSTVPMFADDNKCYHQIITPQDRELLQEYLTWNLNFNAKKCVTLRFSSKKILVPPKVYSLNHETIKSASTQSDLGILVSDNLKWSPHIINIVATSNRMLGFLRRNCFHLTDVHARRLLYLSLVRSHLSFDSEIWAPQGLSADLLRFEGIQRRATKFILQDYESSYVERLKKLYLIPISYWQEIKDIVSFKNVNPAYMSLTSTSSLPISSSPSLVLAFVIFV